MTLQNDQDPGWWRRGMTKRATTIVVVVSVAVLVTLRDRWVPGLTS